MFDAASGAVVAARRHARSAGAERWRRASRGTALAVVLFTVHLAGCAAPPAQEPAEEPEPMVTGAELAERLLVVDTHIDVPYRLRTRGMEDLAQRTRGDFDYGRARQGGLDAAFFSIFVPASYQREGGARAYADELIDMVEGLAAAHPELVRMAASPDEVRASAAAKRLAIALGMENGAPIEDDLASLAHFQRRGIRYITLTHSENNQICDSSYAEERTWRGLSPFGREVVAEMNRLGIMIDVSHVSDETFWQVMELSRAPVIASHSSCRHFTPGWERNMSDEMIRRLAAAGGVVQINFGSSFLLADAQRQSDAAWKEARAYFAANGVGEFSPQADAFWDEYWREHQRIYADLGDVADHIDHVVGLAGVEHVGLGSDFDGVGDSLPTGLKDVSQIPNLLAELARRGYSEEDLRKIAGENLLRVWSAVERVAAQPAGAPG